MLQKVIGFFKIYKWALLSGLLLACSYIPFPPWALFIALVPFLYFCEKHHASPKKLFIAGFLCQFVFTLIGFHWLVYTIHVFGKMPWSLSVLLFIVFCCIAHIFWPLCMLFWAFLIKLPPFQKRWARWLSLATMISLGISYSPMMFKWNLGYPWLYGNWPALHTAEIWGFEFLSTVTIFLQLSLLSVKDKKVFKWLGSSAVFIIVALNILGYILYKNTEKPQQTARVLMVQHNIGSLREIPNPTLADVDNMYKKIVNMTKQSLKKATSKIDFILWPEGGYPYGVRTPYRDTYSRKLKSLVRNEFKIPLITGTTAYSRKGVHNSILFVNKRGQFRPRRYDKRRLLIFGETIPGEHMFPKIKNFFLGDMISFQAGLETAPVRRMSSLFLGLQLCYESLFPRDSILLADNKADILINITNDSWYGSWSEPYQNLYMSIARSIEVRKPMIRLTSTGISAAVSASGDFVTPLSETQTAWAHIAEIPYSKKSHPSLFQRGGSYINLVFLIFCLFLPASWYFLRTVIQKILRYKA